MLGYAWRRRGESPAALTTCFPQGGKTQVLPGSLRLGLREHYRQCCMPGRGCCRKRASCHGAGPARVPLSPLSTHPAHFPARSLPCPKAAEQLCRHASNQRVNSLHPHPDGKSNFHPGCAVVAKFSQSRPSASRAPAPVRMEGDSRGAGFPALPSILCSSRLPISLAEHRGAKRQPAGSLSSSCAASFQQFFPASQGPFCYTAFLYGVPGRQPAPLPSRGGFPYWALQTKLPLRWVLGIRASAGRNLLVRGLSGAARPCSC